MRSSYLSQFPRVRGLRQCSYGSIRFETVPVIEIGRRSDGPAEAFRGL